MRRDRQPGRAHGEAPPLPAPHDRGRDARRPPAEIVRCFVALRPDEAARERLDRLAGEQLARHPSARRMRRENLHLTLAFIGALPRQRARQVAVRLAAEAVREFEWSLDALGAFGGARVLWAGGCDAQLDALAARTRALLDQMDIRFDRKAFVAHVTLLRKLPREAARPAAQPIDPPIRWRAGAPVLLQSITGTDGTRYVPMTAGEARFGEDQ